MSSDLEASVRATLVAAAPDDTHTERGWEDLLARVDGPAVAGPAARTGRRSRRAVLAIAAAIAVLAGIAAVLVADRDGGSPDGVVTTTPSTPPGPSPAPTPASTGWYIPHDLDGWVLESVGIVPGGAVSSPVSRCPCTTIVWQPAGGGGRASQVLVWISGVGEASMDDAVASLGGTDLGTVEIGGEPIGRMVGESATLFVAWERGDRRFVVQSAGLSAAEIRRAARSVDLDLESPPLEGLVHVATSELPGYRSYHDVHLTLRHQDSDWRVTYVLSPPGMGLSLSRFPERMTRDLAGRPFTVVGGSVDTPTWSWSGQLDGADVWASEGAGFGGADAMVEAVEAVLSALRPATAGEWAAFLDTATGEVDDDPSLEVGSIGDLAEPVED